MNGLQGIASLLVGIGSIIGAAAAAYTSWHSSKRLKRVEREVTTLNAQTLAQLADAAETQRIIDKQERGEELTETEQEHIDMVDKTGRQRSSNGGL